MVDSTTNICDGNTVVGPMNACDNWSTIVNFISGVTERIMVDYNFLTFIQFDTGSRKTIDPSFSTGPEAFVEEIPNRYPLAFSGSRYDASLSFLTTYLNTYEKVDGHNNVKKKKCLLLLFFVLFFLQLLVKSFFFTKLTKSPNF